MRKKGLSDGVVMLTMLGLGSHTEYYNVLYKRINNIKVSITNDIIKKVVTELFHKIDRNEDEEYPPRGYFLFCNEKPTLPEENRKVLIFLFCPVFIRGCCVFTLFSEKQLKIDSLQVVANNFDY